MNAPYRRATVLVVLGVTLLANPLYLYPENVSYEETVTFEAESATYVPNHHDDLDARIRSCAWHPMRSWECAILRDLARGDRVELPLDADQTVSRDLFGSLDYVRTADGYFRPNHTVTKGTLVLTLEPVGEATVKRAAAENLSDVPSVVRRAVVDGSASVAEPADWVAERSRYYVRDGGAYYTVEVTNTERRPTGWGWKEPPRIAVEAMRLTAWIGGIVALWRAGEWSERGRRAAQVGERRDDRR